MKHGLSRTSTYNTWTHMMGRCMNPKNKKFGIYGGRGISVCKGWLDVETFCSDMGEKPSPEYSIERLDNSRGYDCGHCEDCLSRGATLNCIWADRFTQAHNKRNNHHIVFGGVSKTLWEWARHIGINPATLYERLGKWSLERALTTKPYLSKRRTKWGK